MEPKERQALYYQDRNGDQPFQIWRDGCGDIKAKVAIDSRITRLRSGNFGDSKSVGSGVSELRVHLGPGYRIYYGIDGDKIILLCGGDKDSQEIDIKRAKELGFDYKQRTNKG